MELLDQKMNFSSVDNGWYADMSYNSPNWRLVKGFYDDGSSRALSVVISSNKISINTL